MKNGHELGKSFVYFRDSKVIGSSNDGMELLGHFLLISADRTHFFSKWLEEPANDSITEGPYFVEKEGNDVLIEHLELERVEPFRTTKASMVDILKRWHGVCTNEALSACGVRGIDVSLSRSDDGKTFTFNTHQ